jgi:hypothetical protein
MSAIHWVPLATEAVQVGDLVSTEAGGMPIYRVLSLANGTARLQGERGPGVVTMPVERLHWKADRED